MKTRARLVLLIAISAGAGVYLHASRRVSTGPDAGVRAEGMPVASAEDRATIRIGTFNIHGCKGLDGHRDPSRIARDLAGLDLVGLNEVRGGPGSDDTNQAREVGQRAEMGWIFAPAESQWYGRKRFGNAMLTRLPVTRWQRIPLPRKYDYSFRNMLLANVSIGGQTVRVLVAHVNQRDPRERQLQLECVLGLFLDLDEPSVLVGDLNTRRGDPTLEAVLSTPGVVDPLGLATSPGEFDTIDWILLRGLRALDAGMLNSGASDHPLIWAEVEVPARAVAEDSHPKEGGFSGNR